jgi:hypothetical protein
MAWARGREEEEEGGGILVLRETMRWVDVGWDWDEEEREGLKGGGQGFIGITSTRLRF